MYHSTRSNGKDPTLSTSSVTAVCALADLERMRGEWEQLLGRSDGLHPFLTPTWLLTWWRVFGAPGTGRSLQVLVVRRGRELVGILPLLTRRCWQHGVLPTRRIEMLATGEDQRDEICSEYLGPLVATGQEDEVVDVMAEHLAGRRARWEEIVLRAQDGQSPAVRRLEAAFRARGLSCERSITGQCPFIELPRSWDDYLAALSSENRYMVKRTLRDFERWAGKDRCRVEVARTYEDLGRGKAILRQLHEHRWQSGGKEGAFASPLFRRFHDMLMPALLERGELDLRWLTVDGSPVAVSYSLVHGRRIFFYQGGRSTLLPKGVRPGIALHLLAIRDAIGAGLLEYDFLAGDARYKTQLAPCSRPLLELRVARRSLPTEALRTAVSVGRRLLRSRHGARPR